MSIRSRTAWIFRGMFHRRRMEDDMDAEMRFHMNAYVEDQLRSGVPRQEAEHRARVEFGMVASLKDQFLQSPSPAMYIVARTRGSRAEAEAAIREAAAAVDNSQPVFDMTTMDKRIAVAQSAYGIFAQSVSSFAVIALFLAAIGIYGVMAYSVTTRHQEIGVRVALGAARRDILALVLRSGLRLTLFGFAAGRLVRSLLYQVTPTDLLTLSAVTALLSLVAVLACYIPARRALRIDPAVMLRYE